MHLKNIISLFVIIVSMIFSSVSFAKSDTEKVALITGASRGIGEALSIELLKDGWIVYGTGRNLEDLQKIQKEYPQFYPIQADFTSNQDVKKIVKIIKSSNQKLKLMVQNAGMKSPPRPLSQYNPEQIDEVMFVNLLTPMKLSALLSDQMLPQSRMLFVTSRAATLRLKESSTYCASKAALNEIAAILRQEFAPQGIAVQAVIPGEVDTHIQAVLRETKTFHLHKSFIEAYEKGGLIKPQVCASFLKWLLVDLSYDDYAKGDLPISIYDEWHHRFWLKDTKDLPPFPF